jgi:hypothetical protein
MRFSAKGYFSASDAARAMTAATATAAANACFESALT